MKNITIWLITLFAFLCGGALTAQQAKIIDLGLFKNPADHKKLEIKLRPGQDVENWSHSAGIFTVRVPSEYGVTLTEVPGSSPYGYSFAGPVGQFEGYDYYRYQFSGSVHFVTWEKGRQYPVLTLQVQGDTPRNARYELVTGNEWTRRHNGDYYQELAGQELERTFYYLPLRMIAFHAEPLPDRTVQLNWELETEELLSHSEVEYSVDGRDFDLIGTEPARDAADLLDPAYSHVHVKPTNVNFYRIRMVGINGEVTYSPVRVINFDDIDADFAVFPNPTSGPLTIASRNLVHYSEGVDYQIIDNSGKVLWFDRITTDNLSTDLSKLPAGAYFVKLLSGKEQLAKFKVILATK